jgi:hypothetical protein
VPWRQLVTPDYVQPSDGVLAALTIEMLMEMAHRGAELGLNAFAYALWVLIADAASERGSLHTNLLARIAHLCNTICTATGASLSADDVTQRVAGVLVAWKTVVASAAGPPVHMSRLLWLIRVASCVRRDPLVQATVRHTLTKPGAAAVGVAMSELPEHLVERFSTGLVIGVAPPRPQHVKAVVTSPLPLPLPLLPTGGSESWEPFGVSSSHVSGSPWWFVDPAKAFERAVLNLAAALGLGSAEAQEKAAAALRSWRPPHIKAWVSEQAAGSTVVLG